MSQLTVLAASAQEKLVAALYCCFLVPILTGLRERAEMLGG